MTVDLETLASLVVLVTTIVGSHALLRKELKLDIDSVRSDLRSELQAGTDSLRADIRRLDDRVTRLDDRVTRIDDRVTRIDDRLYALATGLKPLTEQASREAPGS